MKKFTPEELREGIAQSVDHLYPLFEQWVHQQYHTFGDAKSTIQLWYTFLENSKEDKGGL